VGIKQSPWNSFIQVLAFSQRITKLLERSCSSVACRRTLDPTCGRGDLRMGGRPRTVRWAVQSSGYPVCRLQKENTASELVLINLTDS
jgi:hypothetical protein